MRLRKEEGHYAVPPTLKRFVEPIYEGHNGLRLESPRFAGQIYAEHRSVNNWRSG